MPPPEEVASWFQGYEQAFALPDARPIFNTRDPKLLSDVALRISNLYLRVYEQYRTSCARRGIPPDYAVFGFGRWDMRSERPIRFTSEWRLGGDEPLQWPPGEGAHFLATYIRNSAAHAATRVEFDATMDYLVVIIENTQDRLNANFSARIEGKDYLRMLTRSLKYLVDQVANVKHSGTEYTDVVRCLKRFLVHTLPETE
ncbi:hypothetical protein NKR23_g3077 [Pleurostoma richardsiae]|uniref:Uncharacterized protein n=1 Tax=Pleurostoma richardsiae TaxID=41990 RepID=A0AA38RV28_9PEZI|nr:hypothetical protein NKR23_g3077 [Pleurostoma richardsiae]